MDILTKSMKAQVFESQLLLYIYNHIHVGYSTGTLTNLVPSDPVCFTLQRESVKRKMFFF